MAGPIQALLLHRCLPVLLVLPLAACSMVLRENRRLLGLLDQELTPTSTAAKVALAPVAVPVGLGAFAADLVVVHPIASIDDAWLDTVDLLWRPKDETPLREALFVPVAALATPLVFVGDWFGRWLFPIHPRSEPATGADPKAAPAAGTGAATSTGAAVEVGR